VALGDVNGDGHPDLVSVNGGDDTVSVSLGRGDGTFQPAITYPVGTAPFPLAVTMSSAVAVTSPRHGKRGGSHWVGDGGLKGAVASAKRHRHGVVPPLTETRSGWPSR